MSQFQYVCRASEDVEREMNERAILSEKEELRRLEDLYGPKGEWCKPSPETEPVPEVHSEYSSFDDYFDDYYDRHNDRYFNDQCDDSRDLDMCRDDNQDRWHEDEGMYAEPEEGVYGIDGRSVFGREYCSACEWCTADCQCYQTPDEDDWEADAPIADAEHFFPALIRRRSRKVQLQRSQRRYCA